MKRTPPPIHWPGKEQSGPARQIVQQKPGAGPAQGPRPVAPPAPRVAVPAIVVQRKTGPVSGGVPHGHRVPPAAPRIVAVPGADVRIQARPASPGGLHPPRPIAPVIPPVGGRGMAVQLMKRKKPATPETSEDEGSDSEDEWTAVLDTTVTRNRHLRAMNERMERVPVPAPALQTVTNIIDAAIRGRGRAGRGAGLATLRKIMRSEAVQLACPPTSEGTFAIGIHGTNIISTGSGAFENAVAEELADNHEGLNLVRLGAREAYSHGEITILQAHPNITAVLASQPCCVFCYGYLQKKGIGNPGMRENPYPKGWDHPTGRVSLREARYDTAKYGSFVWVSLEEGGQEKFYRVE